MDTPSTEEKKCPTCNVPLQNGVCPQCGKAPEGEAPAAAPAPEAPAAGETPAAPTA